MISVNFESWISWASGHPESLRLLFDLLFPLATESSSEIEVEMEAMKSHLAGKGSSSADIQVSTRKRVETT